MKSTFLLVMRTLMIITTAALFIFHDSLFAQNKFRIGTYDSRAIAIAFFNSDYASATWQQMNKLKTDYRRAIEDKDTIKSKKCEREGQMRQAILHDKGFGTGSVRDCMAAIKDKVDDFASKEKLDIIVSKWELNYSGTDVEIVDVTEQIINFFQPKIKIKDMLKELSSSEPIKDAYLIED